MEFSHKSVLAQECMEGLRIRPQGIYMDATTGGGGHSLGIVQRLGEGGRLICIDRDDDALRAAGKRLEPYRDKITFVKSNFSDIAAVAKDLGISQVDGILFDLGVSSYQLDAMERGFSYMNDAPLDMRMDRSQSFTAGDVVNGYSQEELKRILWDYGEERYSGRIAAAICRRREEKPIQSTVELAEIIRGAMPPQALREKQHPAKRSFQAIRIAVNDELGSVSRMLQQAIPRLRPGGRLAVISFHSLEDRIVKSELAAAAKGCVCPPSFPVCVCGRQPQVRLVSRKPILPSQREIDENPRARSAKLRLAEKLDQPQGNQPDEVE